MMMKKAFFFALQRRCLFKSSKTSSRRIIIGLNCRHCYSSWFRKIPPQSQFALDVEGTPYKSTVVVENLVEEGLYVDSYSTFGFMLNNGFRVMGPCALFPKTVLSWNIGSIADINMDSLSLFTTLEPKLDLLLIGVGAPTELQSVNKDLYKDLRNKGIGLELLSTHQACATFNFLNGEKRCVAAALFPPKKMPSRNLDEHYIADGLDREMKEEDYFLNPATLKKEPLFGTFKEEKKPLTGGEMPQRYADAPYRPPKLPLVKPKNRLPDSSSDDGGSKSGDSKT